MSTDWNKPTDNITPLLDAVIETIPEAPYQQGPPQMQITSLDFSSFKGRIAIGRVFQGDLVKGKDYMLCKDGLNKKVRIKELFVFEGLGRVEVNSVRGGDLCAVIGLDDLKLEILLLT